MKHRHLEQIATLAIILSLSAPAMASRPAPLGMSTTRVSYMTDAGPVSFSGQRDYTGQSIFDATNLDGAPNIGAFNALNRLGRRSDVAMFKPWVQGPEEALLRHGLYKIAPGDQMNLGGDFFPGLTPGTDITVSIENIQFDQPIDVQEDTFLLHLLWDLGQVDDLGAAAYANPHNHHTVNPFRDFDDFFGPNGVFVDQPVPNYVVGDVQPTFTLTAPDTLSVSITFPYAMMQHLQDDGSGAPPGLPAPQGFLEPFHFHIEYLVAPIPEPATGLLLTVGGLAAIRRRRQPRG